MTSSAAPLHFSRSFSSTMGITASYTAEIELRSVAGGTIGMLPDPETGTAFWKFPAQDAASHVRYPIAST